MSIRIYTDKPDTLVQKVKKLIDQNHIDTWTYDKEGDFTHSVQQFRNKAWLRPETTDDGLRMKVIKPKDENLKRAIYAIYQGRFIEMLITHVSTLFTKAVATADPIAGDSSVVD